MTSERIEGPDHALRAVAQALDGRLELEHTLGAGATGTVRRARALKPLFGKGEGAYFAVKIVREDLCNDTAALQRFRHEAEVSRRLDDPRVVRIHAVETVDTDSGSVLYSIQDYVEGRTLRQFLLEHGPCSDALIRTIGLDAALGLSALHRRGIVHRDIKPENLLITAESEVRLVDFGLALASESGSGSSSGFHGSPAYAAPEVLLGQRHGEAADLYALGLVLFELATGEHPFAAPGRPADEVFRRNLSEVPGPASHANPRLSSFLDELLAGLLRKRPQDRPRSAETLAQILDLGEGSAFWQERAEHAPFLAARRAFESMRRPRPTRFVNRSAETARLERLLVEVRRARVRAIQVVGARGIGRRRLCDEVCERWIEDRRTTVFLGHSAAPEPNARGEAPLADILRDWLLPAGRSDDPLRDERLRFRAREALGQQLDRADCNRLAALLTGSPARDPSERSALYADAFLAIAKIRGTTVVRIDRAEQLGDVARQVIRRTLLASDGVPLLWILVGARAWPKTELPTEVLSVDSLTENAFRRLGTALFRDDEARRDTRLGGLFERASHTLSGSPLALIESLEELVERGQLAGSPGEFHDLSAEVSDFRPASGAIARLTRRLESIDHVTLHALRALAVLGHEFSIDDAAALVGCPTLELLERLADFEENLVAIDGDRGRFRHREYRRAILASTRPEDQRRLHRAAAWVLEDRSAPPIEVGLQLSRAGEHEACIDLLLDGVEQRLADGSLRMATRLERRCRLHLDQLGNDATQSTRRLRWTELSARLASRRGRPDRANAAWSQLSRLGADSGSERTMALAALGLAEVAQSSGRYFAALQHLANAEDRLAEGDGETAELRARIALVQGRVFAYLGQAREALRVTRTGLASIEEAPALEDRNLPIDLRIDLARWQALRLHLERAIHTVEDVLTTVEAQDLPRATARAKLARARILTQRGSVRRVQRMLSDVLDYSRRAGDLILESRGRLAQCEERLYHASTPKDLERLRTELLAATDAGQRASDPFVIELTSAYRHLCGDGDPERLPPDFAVPVLHLTWRIAIARRARSLNPERAQSLCEEAVAVLRKVDVPLPLRLFILRESGRHRHADRLIQSVRARFQDPTQGRRFSQFASRISLDAFEF